MSLNFVQIHRMYNTRSEIELNYGLRLIMMCQCRLSNHNKCTTVVGDVDNDVGCICVGSGSNGEISVPSSQFCCDLQLL